VKTPPLIVQDRTNGITVLNESLVTELTVLSPELSDFIVWAFVVANKPVDDVF
jgi:hypothetical protein